MYADIGAKGSLGEFHLSYTGARNLFGVVGPTPVELVNQRRSAVFTTPQSFDNRMSMVNLNGAVSLTDTLKLSGVVYWRGFRQRRPDGIGDVCGDVLVCGEQPDVLVDPCRVGVGADIRRRGELDASSRRTTSVIFAWTSSSGNPWTTCTPVCSILRAHWMFRRSSKRALGLPPRKAPACRPRRSRSGPRSAWSRHRCDTQSSSSRSRRDRRRRRPRRPRPRKLQAQQPRLRRIRHDRKPATYRSRHIDRILGRLYNRRVVSRSNS